MTLRVVLDTNVCLDAFVFADPRAAALVAAIEGGEVEAVTRDDCREEWLAVLDYPALKLDDTRRAAAVSRFDALVRHLPKGDCEKKPPRCKDPDDQKFLELAASSRASIVFSRDAEVLRLGRRTKREGLFEIMRPEEWPDFRDAD
ncbi:putative toxin-antitoxin system toxin component, PIN family [Luteibacter aegosomaticola]|uniref:putative toxin-antitoxin system toxin component, PIN family n=1 Tax=Luteibacter aegosomaticola TaxID=2911538 RepID=UPI001FF77B07|nr:putative toxin-antitoxin system toxin component, PIN family [Luteibacter aegosomaticola]UPG90056.1 putative toxin-antitoxin system toxin component, PIN family [Luteibacter aegosomaticola]